MGEKQPLFDLIKERPAHWGDSPTPPVQMTQSQSSDDFVSESGIMTAASAAEYFESKQCKDAHGPSKSQTISQGAQEVFTVLSEDNLDEVPDPDDEEFEVIL